MDKIAKSYQFVDGTTLFARIVQGVPKKEKESCRAIFSSSLTTLSSNLINAAANASNNNIEEDSSTPSTSVGMSVARLKDSLKSFLVALQCVSKMFDGEVKSSTVSAKCTSSLNPLIS